MFERFTPRAREVIVHAHDEARTLGHNYIGTEHFLLGLLRDREGVAYDVLESNGIELSRVLAWIERTVGRGTWGAARSIAFTPRGKQVVELSVREADALGRDEVESEHILVALTRLEDGLAARIMAELGPQPSVIADQTAHRSGFRPVAD